MKRLLVFLIIVSAPYNASAFILSWNPNQESDLAGYRVWRAVNSNLQWQMILETTQTQANITDETDGYYYSLTAFDTSQNESARSAIKRYFKKPKEAVNIKR